MSWLPVSLMMIRSKIKLLSCPQYFLHYKYMGKFFDACNSEANSPLWLQMELLQDFMPILVICKYAEDPIKTESAMCPQYFVRRSMAGNSEVNGRMWPELTEIICLCWLPASLMTIRSKLRALLCPQHFLHYKSMRKSFGAQWQVTPKRPIWPEIKFKGQVTLK